MDFAGRIGRAIVENEKRRGRAGFENAADRAHLLHAASCAGSRSGNLAFMGKSVFGRLRVLLRSRILAICEITKGSFLHAREK